MLPTKEFVVCGTKYKTTLLDAVTGRGLYLRVVKAAAPALEKLAGTGEGEAKLLAVAGAILENLPTNLLDDLCDTFGESTVVLRQGGETKLDKSAFGLHFAGKYKEIALWLKECLNANNFLDFLSVMSSPEKPGSSSP